jgi:DNA modification methylase
MSTTESPESTVLSPQSGNGSVELRSTAENGAPRQQRPTGELLTVINADVFAGLAQIAEKSVQCVVTSPPYWGLRSYLPKEHALKAMEIGSEASPDCQGKSEVRSQKSELGEGRCGTCFVCVMLRVFGGKENPVGIWRVLRDDGTVWLNLGDSFMAGKAKDSYSDEGSDDLGWNNNQSRKPTPGLKAKDLIGVPWRVALALQAAGWYLRSDIIWAKPNCMPESVTDRPTRSHEYLFLLTKSPRYFYDAEAIKEPVSENTHARVSQNLAEQVGSFRANGGNKTNGPMKAVIAGSSRKIAKEGQGKRNASYEQSMCLEVGSRNKRDVWWISPALYPEAHFATFPRELVKPCVLAGSSAGGACAECGAPLRRKVEVGMQNEEHQRACGGDRNGEYNGSSTKDHAAHGVQDASAVKARILEGLRERKTVGWEPTCKCGSVDHGSTAENGAHLAVGHQQQCPTVPCVVLDPFGGSGTTAEVALELGHRAILIELNPNYIPLIKQRLQAVTPGLRL